MRIGVIRGGGAGLASAWLLEEQHDVTLFEAESRLGGHAHTIDVEAYGRRIPVDAGFEFFGPGRTYATFNRLLETLGVATRSYRATMTLFRSREGTQVALPPLRGWMPVWPSLTPSALCDLLRFRRFLTGIPEWLAQHDTTITIAEYIERRRLPRRFTDRFLYPFLLAMWCVEPEEFRGFAAYNALFYLGESLSEGFRPPQQLAIEGGMRAYVEALAATLRRTEVRLAASVHRISRVDGGYEVEDSSGARHSFDHVVVATNARQARDLLAPVPGLEPLTAQLSRIGHFATTIAIHGDTRLMPRAESAWSVVNARWDGVHSQLSIWNADRGLPLFKSWITYEQNLPEPLFATATYEHLRVTPEYFDAQRALQGLLGHERIWLAGLYADDADSHESAVRSAVRIAQQLAPDSPRLRQLLG